MTRKTDNNNSTLTKTICAIVFILFAFIYLFFFQADLLYAEQHILSGGTTRYDRTIGAVLITVLLYLLQVGVNRLTRFGGGFYALSYLPSMLCLMLLTAFYEDGGSFGFSIPWMTFGFFALFLFVCFSLFYDKRRRFIENVAVAKTMSVGCLWRNFLTFAVMSSIVGCGGNTDEVFHYRLRAERLIASGHYSDALSVGEKSTHTDASLTMLRVFALSKEKSLGERLFEYPLTGGSNALLPNGKNVRCVFLSDSEIFKQLGIRRKGRMKSMEYLLYLRNHGLALKSVADYILCGYLLDKNLDAFVRELQKHYSLNPASLPKHYKEALILYTRLRSTPAVVFHDEVMDADYADLQKLERKYTNQRERESYVRDAYGETYWYYYFYHKR